MKIFRTTLTSILIAMIFCIIAPAPTFAESSYFESFSADYYLNRTQDNGSELKVVEEITAVFPDYNEHKGIMRYIPYTNKNGTNVTMSKPDGIKVFRNGEVENIYGIEREDGFYIVSTGTDDYIHGRQVFRFEYTFTNVITEFNKDGKSWQELYWDTNGTGWNYSFQQVSARVHLPDDIKTIEGEACYVGRYGSSDSSRCDFYKLGNVYYFAGKDSIQPGENITFAIPFKAGQFTVAEQPQSIFAVPASIAAIIGSLISLIVYGKERKGISEKYKYYHDKSTPVQYIPPREFTVGEMAANYKGTMSNPQVATLLELAVNHKIEIIKGEEIGKFIFKVQPWSIKLLTDKFTLDQAEVLKNITGSTQLKAGETYLLKTNQTATAKKFNDAVEKSLKTKGLTEDKSSKKSNAIMIFLILWIVISIIFGVSMLVTSDPVLSTSKQDFLVFIFSSTIIAVIVLILYTTKVSYYDRHTKAGIDQSRYMDGLKTYIKMAEKDRLNFLQSVDGADTTTSGIVKLYERVLPYATLFGLEKSWLKTLGQYYEQNGDMSPVWYSGVGAFSADDFSDSIGNFSSTMSSSSGDSGSSGGGSSGGGGGGGGGGFR